METCAWCGKSIKDREGIKLAIIKKTGSITVYLCADTELTKYATFTVLGGKGISYDHFFNKEKEPTRFFRGNRERVTAILERITNKGYLLWTVADMHADAERLV